MEFEFPTKPLCDVTFKAVLKMWLQPMAANSPAVFSNTDDMTWENFEWRKKFVKRFLLKLHEAHTTRSIHCVVFAIFESTYRWQADYWWALCVTQIVTQVESFSCFIRLAACLTVRYIYSTLSAELCVWYLFADFLPVHVCV